MDMPVIRNPEEVKREQQLLWVLGHKQVGLQPGSFYQALLEAAMRADSDNLALLELGFPLVVLAVRRWKEGPLARWYGVEDV
jgi:hypothetical protein